MYKTYYNLKITIYRSNFPDFFKFLKNGVNFKKSLLHEFQPYDLPQIDTKDPLCLYKKCYNLKITIYRSNFQDFRKLRRNSVDSRELRTVGFPKPFLLID